MDIALLFFLCHAVSAYDTWIEGTVDSVASDGTGPCSEAGESEMSVFASIHIGQKDGKEMGTTGCVKMDSQGTKSKSTGWEKSDFLYRTSETQVFFQGKGWEDDNGNRCNYDSGDDCYENLSDNANIRTGLEGNVNTRIVEKGNHKATYTWKWHRGVCEVSPTRCGNGGSCVEKDNKNSWGCNCPIPGYYSTGGDSPQCLACKDGFKQDEDGLGCVDVDECLMNTDTCDAISTCINTQGEYTCRCQDGYAYDLETGRVLGSGTETCQEVPVLVIVNSNANNFFTIDLTANMNPYGVYQISVAEWDYTMTRTTVLDGWDAKQGIAGDTDLIRVSNLPAGLRYKVTVVPFLLGAYDTTKTVIKTVSVSCGCSGGNGAPEKFKVTQSLGKMLFTWTDKSMCEEGFALSRRKSTSSTSVAFTGTYYFSAPDSCAFEFDPGQAVTDSLDRDTFGLGDTFEYCVEAIAQGYRPIGYRSDKTCNAATVHWEAKLSGTVLLSRSAGSLPVQNVSIIWGIYDREDVGTQVSQIDGLVHTDREGRFVIYGQVPFFRTLQQYVRLQFSKVEGNISHTFVCNDIAACTEFVVPIRHLQFDANVAIVDTTSVPMRGNVYIKGTEHAEYLNGCPMMEVQVCLWNVNDPGLDTSNPDAIVCTTTNGAGSFELPATLGMTVGVFARYGEHTFHALDHSEEPDDLESSMYARQYYIQSNNEYMNIDFVDITTEQIQVEVAGGKCSRLLGTSTVKLQRASCPTWEKTSTFFGVGQTLTVPAQDIEVALEEVVDEQGAVQGQVTAYIGSIYGSGRAIARDLRNLGENNTDGRLIRFEYHPQPTVSVRFEGNPVSSTCPNSYILKQFSWTKATIDVREDFGGNIVECDWIEGNVVVTNQLGESVDTIEKKDYTNIYGDLKVAGLLNCRDSCTIPIQVDPALEPGTLTRCEGWTLVGSSWNSETTSTDSETVGPDMAALGKFVMQEDTPISNVQVMLECGTSSSGTAVYSRLLYFNAQRSTLGEHGSSYSYFDYNPQTAAICDPWNETTTTRKCPQWEEQIIAGSSSDVGAFKLQKDGENMCNGVSTAGTWGRVWVRADVDNRLPTSCGGSSLTTVDQPARNPQNARVVMDLFTGDPETNKGVQDSANPHTKLFEVRVSVPYQNTVVVPVKVVVTGDIKISDDYSISMPDYEPLLVLRDPPGGGSFQFFENVVTEIEIESKTTQVFQGTTAMTKTGTSFSSADQLPDTCTGAGGGLAGPFLALCKALPAPSLETVVTASVEDNVAWRSGTKESGKSSTLELTWSMSTSPDVAGGKMDMFMVPALTIVYTQTNRISWDSSTCLASSKELLTYSLKKGGSNQPAFTWLAYQDIENSQIPDLQNLADDAKAKGETGKYEKLMTGVRGWQRTLDRHDNITDLASKRKLPKLKLMDGSILVNGRDKFLTGKDDAPDPAMFEKFSNFSRPIKLDTSEASDEDIQGLSEINQLTFSGGGHTFAYTMTEMEEIEWVQDATERQNDFITTADWDNNGGMLGAEILFSGSTTYTVISHKTADNVMGKARSTGWGFELSDPDEGDIFNVGVFVDTRYHTLVFDTVSGFSSCPYEEGTVSFIQPGLSVSSAPSELVLPDQPAIFKLLVQNNGEVDSSLILFMNQGSNPGGLTVLVDGSPLVEDRLFESVLADSAVEVVVEIFRGPTQYTYKALEFGLGSWCDRLDQNGDRDSWKQETVSLDVGFIEPCPLVEFAGDLKDDQSFAINYINSIQENRPSQLRVVAVQPNLAEGLWAENPRLDDVRMEYRSVSGNADWRSAMGENSILLDFKVEESKFGYVTKYWQAANLPDGQYEIRLVSQCRPTVGIQTPPLGIDTSYSSSIFGTFDRVRPLVFGLPEPADGVFVSGDNVCIVYSEPISCTQPFSFQVQVTLYDLKDSSNPLHNLNITDSQLIVICEQRKICIGPKNEERYSEMLGMMAQVYLTGVEDMVGNKADDFGYTFEFDDMTDSPAAVTRIAVDALNTPELATQIEGDLNSVLDPQTGRRQHFGNGFSVNTKSGPGGITIVDVLFNDTKWWSTSNVKIAVNLKQKLIEIAQGKTFGLQLSALLKINTKKSMPQVVLDDRMRTNAAILGPAASGSSGECSEIEGKIETLQYEIETLRKFLKAPVQCSADKVCSSVVKLGKSATVQECALEVISKFDVCGFSGRFNYRERNGACICSTDGCETLNPSTGINAYVIGTGTC